MALSAKLTNDDYRGKELAVSEDQVKTLLELETYRQRIYDPIRTEAELNLTDEEAQHQQSLGYLICLLYTSLLIIRSLAMPADLIFHK